MCTFYFAFAHMDAEDALYAVFHTRTMCRMRLMLDEDGDDSAIDDAYLHEVVRAIFRDTVHVNLALNRAFKMNKRDAERMIRALLDAHTDINAIRDGETGIDVATRCGYVHSIRMLLARGADVNAPCSCGNVPVVRASFFQQYDVMMELIYCGANPNAASVNGARLINTLVWHGRGIEWTEMLCRAGADPNATDREGHTPIWYALARFMGGSFAAVGALLRCGAVIDESSPEMQHNVSVVRLVIAEMGGPDGVRAAHLQWLAEAPGRRTKAAR